MFDPASVAFTPLDGLLPQVPKPAILQKLVGLVVIGRQASGIFS